MLGFIAELLGRVTIILVLSWALEKKLKYPKNLQVVGLFSILISLFSFDLLAIFINAMVIVLIYLIEDKIRATGKQNTLKK